MAIIADKHYTKPVLIGFLVFLNTVWTGLAVALVWQNATQPIGVIESCVEVQVKRAAP